MLRANSVFFFFKLIKESATAAGVLLNFYKQFHNFAMEWRWTDRPAEWRKKKKN